MNTGTKWALGIGAGAAIFGGIWALSRKTTVLGEYRPGAMPMPRAVSTVRNDGRSVTLFRGPRMTINQRVAVIQKAVFDGVHDPKMRQLALSITRQCPERDGLCEARAIFDAVKSRIRYTGDVGAIKHPDGAVEGIDYFQTGNATWNYTGGGDCLPKGTLLLVEGHRLVAIEDVIIGSRIWGLDGWTVVRDVWAKGILPVDEILLNNGSSFKATSDHKVYVALCKHHPVRWSNGGACSCPMSERSVERLHIAQLEEKMVLLQPERIAFGTETMDPDRALIEGLYLSDGWCEDYRFSISGQDGQPKEAQKKRVEEICHRLGITTNWQPKHIRVNDPEWALRMAKMGHRASVKHALSINLDELATIALLDGILADSGTNTHGNGRTFTTTSRELMLQTRLLVRMLGGSCSERYIVDHGGLGEHPIWRLGIRDVATGKAEKLLRVKSIERDVMQAPVYDIATEDHFVYLPEADVTVSNCDDHNILLSTMLALNGITPRLRVTSQKGEDWSHIYTIAGMPKNDPNKWVALDTTLPGRRFNVEAPYDRFVDYDA